jgi:hypothetical protein
MYAVYLDVKDMCRHHEVPLTEIAGGHAADVKDPNASVRTPNLERKKNRGSSKAKLAFDGAPTVAQSKETAKEDESSPRAGFNSGCHDTFGADSPRIASPVHCKSPEKFLSARRFISSATSDEYVAGNDGAGVLRSSSFRVNMFVSQFVNDQMSTEPDIPVFSTSSAGACVDEEKPSPPSLHWQDTIFSKLKDTSRLRKSLGSALRVKIDDSADNPNSKPQGAGNEHIVVFIFFYNCDDRVSWAAISVFFSTAALAVENGLDYHLTNVLLLCSDTAKI